MILSLKERVEWRLRLVGPILVSNAVHATMGHGQPLDEEGVIREADIIIDHAMSITPRRGGAE
jgi:hypothetical protein